MSIQRACSVTCSLPGKPEAMKKPVTIVGGGLAGLNLGLALRRKNIPVTVLEAGDYPRHRVCGAFISGRGQATLDRMGLLEPLFQAGAIRASTAAFVLCQNILSPARRLEQPAVCLSRYT